jgi:PREDICTED: similar to CHKB protein
MISSLIARKLAHVHALEVPINKEPCWLFNTMYSWLENIRNTFTLKMFPKDKRRLGQALLEFDYETELSWLQSFLSKIVSPVVFSHNDLQEGNILLPNRSPLAQRSANAKCSKGLEDKIVLIDFEYCSYNYRGFDFANHFCEWAFDYSNPNYPYFYFKPDRYPSETEKRHFIREYVKSSEKCKKAQNDVNSEDHILNEANYFTLASHLLWTLWSITSGHSSKILFGYWVCKPKFVF